MADEKLKIYEPNEIEDTPIYPVEDETGSTDSTSDTTGVSSPNTLPPTKMPNYVMAIDLVNESLDTQMRKIKADYGFTETGSLQIGKYVASVSGQILISPDGIVAISKDDGLPSITIDGQTGNATFKGTVAAGSVVAASITVDGSSTFGTGYNPTDKVDEVGGNYTSTATASAAKVKIFPDANTGIIAYTSDGTTVVFKVEVGGTNVGDVTIGNYGGGVGMLWDQSAGKLYIKGDMTAGTITGVNFKTASSGVRVEMSASSATIKLYGASNEVFQLDDDGTDVYLEAKDSRNIVLKAAGTIQVENSNGLEWVGSRSSAPSYSWGMYHWESGGSYGYRTRMEGGNWQIDQTAV